MRRTYPGWIYIGELERGYYERPGRGAPWTYIRHCDLQNWYVPNTLLSMRLLLPGVDCTRDYKP